MTRTATGNALCLLALACGIVAIPYLPFLFAPLGFVLLLTSAVVAKTDKRLASVAVTVLVVGAIAGMAIAASYSRPLL